MIVVDTNVIGYLYPHKWFHCQVGYYTNHKDSACFESAMAK